MALQTFSKLTIPRAESLPFEVAKRLREAVANGEIKPGEKLPSEQALCQSYGVSRSVVREAISLLKSDGLIISQQGRGQFVNPEGSSAFRMDPGLEDRESLARLYEFLLAVEVTATEMAAMRRTARQLEAIRKCCVALENAVNHSSLAVQEDIDFHRAVVNASQNEHFIAFSNFLENRVRRLVMVARSNTASQARELVLQVQEEHHAIYRAIKAQDVSMARVAARTHLQNSANRLMLYRGANAIFTLEKVG
jgi:DNA-binding FadR family transcriptional regulator